MLSIRGLQRTSLVDYPGRLCATIFLYGCNFRCPYCHNPDLVRKGSGLRVIKEEEVIAHLQRRKGIIEALCVTGGEPCLQKCLPKFLRKVKALGVLVKLDTNGTHPEIIQYLVANSLVDYIAMDIKAPLEKYPVVVRRPVDLDKIRVSVDTIRSSGVEYEFRTTVVPTLLDEADMTKIGHWLKDSKRYVIQQFRANGSLLDPAMCSIQPYPAGKLVKFQQLLQSQIEEVQLRGIL
jgi:pyruvate formate lyase activating enzyme